LNSPKGARRRKASPPTGVDSQAIVRLELDFFAVIVYN